VQNYEYERNQVYFISSILCAANPIYLNFFFAQCGTYQFLGVCAEFTLISSVFIPSSFILELFYSLQVIIGDNLGCHFSERVIVGCRENNISFVSLIPNSTHLSQPLDVSVFRPLKIVWAKILGKWRRE